ncbi:pyridoxine-5'-phosphate oxidase-like [Pollicipes pollicipes]|uniref:pyridoxine-5'-phosphate oxidase-like n=1 Tax=Pollicipes pollicipes TaxID=41117 RepID=UPI001884CF04|nr:pyridoxine-5'-phosphate oxidase-like [Pollicipes pollicipes]XP_037088948.1 pyridoxine-5'-phosphate oxidase-like [Pollicipes pollicipes]
MDHSGVGDPEVNIESMRHPYKAPSEAFTEDQLVAREPIAQFRDWFDQASRTPGILEPNAMCLSTASADGAPSGRFVLLKGFGRDGFRFFTNYGSRKAADLDANPRAALTFYWEALNRSVRVEGAVRRLPADVSDAYFHSRPLASQIGAALFRQSATIADRGQLERREAELRQLHPEQGPPVPRPDWGGYIVEPRQVEFWQGQSTRIHDRIRFRRPVDGDDDDPRVRRGDDGWVLERLAP